MSEVVKINPDLPMLDRPDALNFEANRLKTFDGWSGPVSACRLSRDGFFKSGDGNETQCFSCGEKYSRWSEADKPHEVHRRLSPRCRMVREHCHEMDPRGVGPNIPIPLRHPQSFAVRYPAFETFYRLVCRQPIKESGAVEPDNYVNGILGVNLRHVQFPNRADGNLRIGRSPDGSLPYTAQADVELVPAPCYPHFSSAVIRHSSFSTFSLTHLVEQLVRNGFFSVGKSKN